MQNLPCAFLLVASCLLPALRAAAENSPTPAHDAARTRLIILADMGNEPDEEQQIVHLMMYANAFDFEGLVAVTGKYLRAGPRPELFLPIIDGYEKVLPNLRLHASGWPDAAALRSVVCAGQPGYGIADTGPGKSTAGSALIIAALERDDPRPLYVVVNAGSNTLAQALIDFRTTRTPPQLATAIAKLRVFENGAQDNAGAWLCHTFPDLHWIRSNYQTYCYAGPSVDGGANNKGAGNNLGPHTWEPYAYNGIGQHQWALEHIKGGHGPLGVHWPIRQFKNGGISFLEGGGTIPWLGATQPGLSSIEHPEWGGWSGRYSRTKTENVWSKHGDVKKDEEAFTPFALLAEENDTWTNPENGETYTDNLYAPVWRWRRAFFNDFRCRMDWCIKPFSKANHAPLAVVDGDAARSIIHRTARVGETLRFDASASTDPDHDKLGFAWYFYPEAGTYRGALDRTVKRAPTHEIKIPDDAGDTELHLILEVADESRIASLTSYRRVVIEVAP